MDSIFLLTIGFIFLGALFSNVMKWRNKDRVLKDLEGFHSTFEMLDNKKIWGKTQVYTNGIELHFLKTVINSVGDPINSYIFYRDDIDQIQTIFRNHTELSKENQQRRNKEILVVSNPDRLTITKRKIRIFFNMFNDAIGEALNVFLSRMKGGKTGAMVFDTQSDYLKKMGTTALSAVGNSYDPILEKYVNGRVVVTLKNEKTDEKYCGFLKEYSSAWMSILDCRVTHAHHISINDVKRLSLQRDMDFSYYLYEESEGELALDIVIEYFGAEPLKIVKVKGENYSKRINKSLKHKQSISFTLSKLPSELYKGISTDILPLEFEMIAEERREGDEPVENEIYQSVLPEFELHLQYTHIADVYVPRTLATLRHGSE